jgi:hypothetical protein
MKLYNDPQTEQVLAHSFSFLNDAKDYIDQYSFELITLLEFKAMRNAVIELDAMIPKDIFKNALALETFNPLINLTSEGGPELFSGEILELPNRIAQIKEELENVRIALAELEENA